ncbi:MAG: hypothetical protein AAF985_24900, partial [Bacteroidota bacterium]
MKKIKTNQLTSSIMFRFVFAFCLLSLSLSMANAQGDCTNDILPPSVIAPPDTSTICLAASDYTDTLFLQANFGNATALDNCTAWTKELPPLNSMICPSGVITRRFQAIDQAGNVSAIAQQQIFLENSNYTIHLPGQHNLGDPLVDSLTVSNTTCNLVAVSYEDVLYNTDCDEQIERTERTYSVINWCNFNDGIEIELPQLDLDNDGVFGDPYELLVTPDSAYIIDNGTVVTSLKVGIFKYTQTIYQDSEAPSKNIKGQVYLDANENCSLDTLEDGLTDWTVQLHSLGTNTTYETTTDLAGNYEFIICPEDSLFDLQLLYPFNYSGTCPTTYSFNLGGGDTMITVNLPVQLSDCPLMSVDVSSGAIRPCLNSNYYVNYRNLSTQTIEMAEVQIVLDPYMTFVDSDQTYLPPMGDTIIFPIGDLPSATHGSFSLTIALDCEVEMGQTHCVEARIFPDSICPPSSSSWSGASVALESTCDNDSLKVMIKNIGEGNMQAARNYIVIEDVLMREEGNFQLSSGMDKLLSFPANGATWHISAEQVPHHPGLNQPLLTIEGCGGINNPGQALSFPQNDADLFVSIDCQQNVNSFDPNDKLVFPQGVGDNHLVEANTDLSYKIRFQNTGTAPALKVVVIDTLSAWLDASTVQPGTSSHDYTFERLEGGILRFTFDDINLPDSTQNEAESHGFVKFRIKQKLDNPIGIVIDNSAAIYFDFNAPIITNNTFVTIGEELYEVTTSAQHLKLSEGVIEVFPNPAKSQVNILFKQVAIHSNSVLIYSLAGQL